MNPLVLKQLTLIQDHLAALEDALIAAKEQLNDQRAANKALRIEHLKTRKELTALKRLADDYDALDQHATDLRTQRTTLRTGLQQILAWTKALSQDLQP